MGCGWLGTALAMDLLKKGYLVKGTTTQISKLDDLRDAGIDPYVVDLKETFIDGGIDAFLEGLDALVVNIPPGLRSNPESDYAGRINLLMKNINAHKNIRQLLYISTTAVFQDKEGIPTYDESVAPNATDSKGKKLIAAEQIIHRAFKNSSIIRPGGLIGNDRHPIKMLAGKTGISNPEAPVNLTSREYLVAAISKIIAGEIHAPVLHAISEPHEGRKSYYTKMARAFELEPPIFEKNGNVGKRIVSIEL